MVNPKLNFLFIFLDPAEEFDAVDNFFFLQTLYPMVSLDNITFLFLLSISLAVPSSFLSWFFFIFHYAGVLLGSELEHFSPPSTRIDMDIHIQDIQPTLDM